MNDRRRFLGVAAGLGLGALGAGLADPVAAAAPAGLPPLPRVGLGTWRKFDVRPEGPGYRAAADTLRRFAELGGRLVDSSPMYGRASAAVGAMAATQPWRDRLFYATKLWTRGSASGRAQLHDERNHLGRACLDLVQVHNLNDFATQLAVLRAAREAGEVDLIGASHYRAAAHDDMRRALQEAGLQVIQINYSILEPEADRRLLSVARDHGVAVLANRCFAEGALFERVRGQALPGFVRDAGFDSWAGGLLGWVLGHPAISVAITGSSNPRHIEQNLQIARAPAMPASVRSKLADFVRQL